MENNTLLIERKPHLLRDTTFQFAVHIIRLYKYLNADKKEYILSRQVLRSGTNPGAMIRDALNAESHLEFIHKLAIAQKEIGETQYWLELLYEAKYLSEAEFHSLYFDAQELMKITRSTILTKKKNMITKASILIITMTLITHMLF
jgi:four helix bundle protein